VATEKQLAALAKGRKTRAANLAKKKKGVAVKKKAAPKKRKTNPVKKPRKTGDGFRLGLVRQTGGVIYTDAYWTGRYWDSDEFFARIYPSLESAKKASEDAKKQIKQLLKKYHGHGIAVETVKKPDGRYAKNPVPASSRARQNAAAALYSDFTGHDADLIERHHVDWPDTGLTIGKCDGILYETVRDGVTEHYVHRFKKSARPTLGASHDGTTLVLIGGKYRFTERGIVDD